MKTKSWELIFVSLVALSILPFAPPGFAGDSTLQVKCLDSSGNPIQNAKVTIVDLNNQKSKDKKSDPQGEAEFAKLDDGVYRVYGRKDGFAPALFEYALLKESKESVTLTFAAGADKKLHFEDPALEQQAQGFMRQGLDSYRQGKFADAEKLLGQSLEISPSDPEELYYCAIACLQLSKFDQTVEMLNRSAKMAGILKTMPMPSGQPNRYEQVYQGAQQLLKKLPAMRGGIALNQKKYDEAIAQFSEAIKTDPGNAEYYANLAIALANAKRLDEAMAAIEKAIQLKPDETSYATLKKSIAARREDAEIDKAQSIMNDGNKLLQDGDAAGALKKYEEAKSMVPEDKQSPLWRQIARAQAKLNQPDAAVASFKKSIELAPADRLAEYRDSFARFYLEGKRYDEAVDILADPKNAGSRSPEQILLELAKTQKDKEPALAEAALERVIKSDPDNADAYFDLGQMYYADGKAKDSRTKELLTKYVEVGKDPDKLENAKNMLVMINRRNK